ncbi:LolA-like putative outer membrane lipoprotein chaperone [uncultured Bacteroides sp.]|uniref:LolA-like putative outer membrane lipoprotein chaperone n=1 Tax=uncultured Bacteroides sp. TaxID=162156 RepID=UPI002AA6D262|nr:LolA-like putative outer membrane lipoprotein chaperone [uncultured Bacteroides sp.]
MKKLIFTLSISLFSIVQLFAQQREAKSVLDKTAASFRKSEGIKAEFEIKSFSKGHPLGQTEGVIQLKGQKFMLKTPEATTWFDGKTQWSYLSGSEEVNISTPTEEELRNLNPYTLLYMYKKGFSYKLGATTIFRGRPIYEIKLVATDKNQNLISMILYIAKDSYQPLYIVAEQRDKSRSEITVTGYQNGQKYIDSLFVFNKNRYPKAEIIDLR